jgi:hypothetical protein
MERKLVAESPWHTTPWEGAIARERRTEIPQFSFRTGQVTARNLRGTQPDCGTPAVAPQRNHETPACRQKESRGSLSRDDKSEKGLLGCSWRFPARKWQSEDFSANFSASRSKYNQTGIAKPGLYCDSHASIVAESVEVARRLGVVGPESPCVADGRLLVPGSGNVRVVQLPGNNYLRDRGWQRGRHPPRDRRRDSTSLSSTGIPRETAS